MPTLVPSAELFAHFSELVARPAHWRALAGGGDNPQHLVEEFLGRLRNLEGVPFPYLVPTNAMLPPESIRFFFLDRNWLDALADGALSLGRITFVDLAHDEALVPVLNRGAERTVLGHRCRQLRLAPRAEPGEEPVYTGFLLRSAVVSGWPGLEVRATAAASGSGPNTRCSGEDIDMIRMDRLSADVLLCIFAGRLGCVQVHEPKEGLNYGVAPEFATGEGETTRALEAARDGADPVRYVKALRGLGVGGYEVGAFIDGAEVEVPLRDAASRVVSLDALRKRMVAELEGLSPPAWDKGEAGFTSAQFSLEMVEGASQQIFRAIDDAPTPRLRRTALDTALEADRATLNRFLFGQPQKETP